MKIAYLTAGGLAPCLSTAIAALTEIYAKENVDLIAYKYGYEGLLKGDSFVIDEAAKANAGALYEFGGSPIGNSRVKLTNAKDLVKRKLVQEGEDPLRKAADQLVADGVDVLHTIGGDDTNTTAADLAAYLKSQGYNLRVVGLPKTIDNDIIPIKQSLGASTAADETVQYAKNVIAEHSASPRSLIIHEVMGRHCGYLTAESAIRYQKSVDQAKFNPAFGLTPEKWSIHGVYIPEIAFDISKESARLKTIMDQNGNVNVFFAEGAVSEDQLLAELGEDVPRDAFGHIQLDKVNPGKWFAEKIGKEIGASKIQVFKSGYFARSAWSNAEDLDLIKRSAKVAAEAALNGGSGVVGEDDNTDGKNPNNTAELVVIDFERIAGAKAYNVENSDYQNLLRKIGQN